MITLIMIVLRFSITFTTKTFLATILEAPATFTKPLHDLTANEKDTITLTCDLSKPNTPCKWFKDNQEIKPSDHAQISYDGYTQQLLLTDVTVDDTATYSCVCGDVSTEATLQVHGTWWLKHNLTLIHKSLNQSRFFLGIEMFLCVWRKMKIIVLFLFLFLESLKFIKELAETRVIEEHTVTLECEVNQPV